MKLINNQVKNTANIEAVCCLDSVYSLLLYLLIEPTSTEKTLFIFGRGVSENIYKQFDNYIIVNHPTFNRTKVYISRIFYYYYFKFFFKRNKLEKLPKYGHDFLRWTDYFVSNNKSNFYVIEDGVGNYTCPNIYYQRYKKNKIIRFLTDKIPMLSLPYGLSKSINTVYLTGILETPKLIEEKVKIIDILSLWNKKTTEEKNEILKLYSVSQKTIDVLSSSGRNVLLLTQCLSESNIMTEENKIKLYKDIISNYDENKLIIKTHPREKTDYKVHFKSSLIVNDPFPVQLLFMLGFEIDKVVTYSSTSIYTLPEGITEKIIIKPIQIN